MIDGILIDNWESGLEEFKKVKIVFIVVCVVGGGVDIVILKRIIDNVVSFDIVDSVSIGKFF